MHRLKPRERRTPRYIKGSNFCTESRLEIRERKITMPNLVNPFTHPLHRRRRKKSKIPKRMEKVVADTENTFYFNEKCVTKNRTE